MTAAATVTALLLAATTVLVAAEAKPDPIRSPEIAATTATRLVTATATATAMTATVTATATATAMTATATRGSTPDFDGDGYADLAIGAPYTSLGKRASGVVHVVYGSASGPTSSRREVWSQAHTGIADTPERGDQFGWAVATADFDGDGYSDLAVGARWESRGAWHAGAVHIIPGSPSGLSSTASQLWTQDSPGIDDRSERGDGFGTSLVAADFDGDGYGDLAVGSPMEDRGARDAGVVNVLYGTPSGLSADRSQVWNQASRGVADSPGANDHFGRSLTAGDFDGDGRVDLAIGVPYEGRRVHRMGIVHILQGTGRGLSAKGSQVWHQDSAGIREHAELRDQFGQSLASADFDGDGYDDLVAGVWFEDYRNELSNEGGFHVIYGTRKGLRAAGNQFWNLDSPGIKDRARDSDNFGQALGTGDFDGDGFDDLAVGSPSTDLRLNVHQNRGAVHIFRGSRRGITATGDRYITQDTTGIPDRSERYDRFGSSVAGADFDGDGFDDLAVGIPWEDRHSKNDGAVYVMLGSKRGLTTERDALLTTEDSGLSRAARRAGRFGWSLSGERPASDTTRTNDPRI
jgi:hypothetical protein